MRLPSRLPAALAFAVSSACTAHEPPAAAPSDAELPEARPRVQPPAAATEATPAGTRLIVGEIVDEGPIGDGPCTQKSYAVQPADGGAPQWVHFEHCTDAGGPSALGAGLEALKLGGRYRLTVRDGASPNFGDAPVLLDAIEING